MNLSDDDFELFALPRRFELDSDLIGRRWRELQAKVHPDRFVAEGAASRRVAMQWAVRVNEAHRRLKDSIARGAYLCELAGVSIDPEDNTSMPADFLMQQMQWREALEEASDVDAVQSLRAQVQEDRARRIDRLSALIDRDSDYEGAAREVRALMFVDRFDADVDRRLEVLEQ